jgi:fatty acid desaturase
MIEDYVEEGERVFKLELWIAAICLISFLFLIILFIFTSSFVLLIFSYLALVFFKVYLYRLPKERFRLYKRSTN